VLNRLSSLSSCVCVPTVVYPPTLFPGPSCMMNRRAPIEKMKDSFFFLFSVLQLFLERGMKEFDYFLEDDYKFSVFLIEESSSPYWKCRWSDSRLLLRCLFMLFSVW
jgi:hypothetical protein